MDVETSAKVAKLQRNLADLHLKQADLMESLNRSLKIKGMWPQAFAHGSCKSGAKGLGYKLEDYVFQITDGEGNIKEFPLLNVHISLWEKLARKMMNAAKQYKWTHTAVKLRKLMEEANI